MAEDGRRRRRRRPRPAAAAGPSAPAAAGEPESPREPAEEPPARRRAAPRDSNERGLRDLAGSGRSMLGVDGALRARDVNRPTEDDLAEAERDVVIVRRHWRPDTRS